jgi:hypothetical protein
MQKRVAIITTGRSAVNGKANDNGETGKVCKSASRRGRLFARLLGLNVQNGNRIGLEIDGEVLCVFELPAHRCDRTWMAE